MTNQTENLFLGSLAERWWAPVVRGVAAILAGIVILALPRESLYALVFVWGAYAIIDGIFNFTLAARSGRAGERWGWFLVEGAISVAAGVLAFVYPRITAVALLYVIAFWAVLTGIAEIAAAIELRKIIRQEWLLALAGILSIAFGVILFMRPGVGALAVVGVIGTYCILFGVVLVALGLKLRGWSHPRGRTVPTAANARTPG